MSEDTCPECPKVSEDMCPECPRVSEDICPICPICPTRAQKEKGGVKAGPKGLKIYAERDAKMLATRDMVKEIMCAPCSMEE